MLSGGALFDLFTMLIHVFLIHFRRKQDNASNLLVGVRITACVGARTALAQDMHVTNAGRAGVASTGAFR